MQAFHNKQKIKNKYLSRVRNHRKLDNIIQGKTWEDGKGCAVGCTLENYNHKQYEIELGIPEWLAQVEDTIFEGLSKEKALLWPEKFLSVINPGANLESVNKPFLIFILKQNFKYINSAKYDKAKYQNVAESIELTKKSLKLMIKYHETGTGLEKARLAARSAADSAYSAAYSADSARSAADSARSAYSVAYSADSAAYSADSARSAAYSAAYSADSARSAAYSAARSAADSADSAAYSAARSARSAAYLARSAAYYKYACKLIQLLREAK